MKKFYITGTKRGLGFELFKILPTVNSLEECNIFVNCKHDGFDQVELLYKACDLGIQTISIGSYASDWVYHPTKSNFKYAIEKKALRDANSQLFDNGYDVTCINFGYFDTERVAHIKDPKMDLDYVIEVFFWVLGQPHRIKELTVVPRG